MIGVMPDDFRFPLKSMLGPSGFTPAVEPDGWMPVDLNKPRLATNGVPVRTVHALSVVGRLAPGVTLPQAREEISSIVARLEQQYPECQPRPQGARGGAPRSGDRPRALGIGAAAGGRRLRAAHGLRQRRQPAARAQRRASEGNRGASALGAGRARLVSQMLVESLLLALAGGVLGLGLMWIGVDALLAMAPPELPRLERNPSGCDSGGLHHRRLAAGRPRGRHRTGRCRRQDEPPGRAQGHVARRCRRRDAPSASSRPGRRRIALAVLLTAGAGLLLRSFVTLLAVDPGFGAEVC